MSETIYNIFNGRTINQKLFSDAFMFYTEFHK